MNPVLRRVLDSNTVIANGETYRVHSAVSRAEGELLQRMIATVKPSITLEVGMAYGVSTLFMCEALAALGSGRHIAIDPVQSTVWHGAGLAQVREAGYETLVTLHEQGSEFALPHLLGEGLEIGVALIDGWHTFDHALVDFFYVNRLLTLGGVVVIDDVAWPSLDRLVRHVLTYPAYRLLDTVPMPETTTQQMRRLVRRRPKPLGAMVAIQKIATDGRPWDWWADF
jgi:predicted O-methyltransferase YrrM